MSLPEAPSLSVTCRAKWRLLAARIYEDADLLVLGGRHVVGQLGNRPNKPVCTAGDDVAKGVGRGREHRQWSCHSGKKRLNAVHLSSRGCTLTAPSQVRVNVVHRASIGWTLTGDGERWSSMAGGEADALALANAVDRAAIEWALTCGGERGPTMTWSEADTEVRWQRGQTEAVDKGRVFIAPDSAAMVVGADVHVPLRLLAAHDQRRRRRCRRCGSGQLRHRALERPFRHGEGNDLVKEMRKVLLRDAFTALAQPAPLPQRAT